MKQYITPPFLKKTDNKYPTPRISELFNHPKVLHFLKKIIKNALIFTLKSKNIQGKSPDLPKYRNRQFNTQKNSL